jgi:hypothetical protein
MSNLCGRRVCAGNVQTDKPKGIFDKLVEFIINLTN